MNKIETFEQFLAGQTPSIEITDFIINLFVTLALVALVSFVYVRFGKAASNRRLFAKNLVVIALTTMLIITIVKSSLALSLGLVGALSIVRFRTPIKEPEELSYLFLSIGIGLGLGAGQRAVTAFGCLFILAVIWLRGRWKKADRESGMHLSITAHQKIEDLLDKIVDILNRHSDEVNIHRLDETGTSWQGDFFVSFSDYSRLKEATAQLRLLDPGLEITFLDNHLL
jgi:uncharacterized membrane protein YhiD involved in acid resistance